MELEPGNTRLINQINGPITALKELLVPVDFSDCSKYALRYALAFAEQFDANVTLVSVVPMTARVSNTPAPNTPTLLKRAKKDTRTN